jgi:hypothetical protein
VSRKILNLSFILTSIKNICSALTVRLIQKGE